MTDPVFFRDGPERPQRPVLRTLGLVAAFTAATVLGGSVAVSASVSESDAIRAVWDDYSKAIAAGSRKNPVDHVALIDEALVTLGEMAETVSEPCEGFLGMTASMLGTEYAYWTMPGDTSSHGWLYWIGVAYYLEDDDENDMAGLYENFSTDCAIGI